MIPVLTPSEMGEVDRAAPEPTEVLVRRAAGAVARAALGVLGGGYGRRVHVVAGPGNNGADGRVAAQLLARRGVRTVVHPVGEAPPVLRGADLVVDAAFGTGFRGTYELPDPDGAPVLAVDIPSGVDGLTGVAAGRPAAALSTVTFAALKPGLVLGDGPALAGGVHVADIGLDVGRARCHLVEDADVVAWVPDRDPSAHKWRHAVRVVAGSSGMEGASALCADAALRGGSGYVRVSSPGVDRPEGPREAVGTPLGERGWADEVLADANRFAAFAVGPGLGRSDHAADGVRHLAAALDRPLVVDGDGLWALGAGDGAASVLAVRSAPTVLTPHDGEYARLTGAPPGPDRVDAARTLAAATGCTVLLKGPTTVVADPDGTALLVRRGDQRLATAGTGDVLTGLVAAHLALGAAPLRAAAAAAQLHGAAAGCCPPRGTVAGDVASAVPRAWAELGAGDGPGRF